MSLHIFSTIPELVQREADSGRLVLLTKSEIGED
jgi:hypothetical protein